MTDVWTSAGVVLGVGAVALTGWVRLDPIIALIVAANILRIGWQLLGRSVRGLMDATLPAAERDAIKRVLNRYESQGIQYHALRTRQAGTRAFISLHVLVPRDWTVQRGHDLLEQLERDIRSAVPGAQLFTHSGAAGRPRRVGRHRTGSQGSCCRKRKQLVQLRLAYLIWHTTSISAGFPSFTTFTASRKVLMRSFGSVIGPAPQQP